MQRLLGVDVPDDAQGVLQDVHWGAGLFGYFPTYTLGNLIAAQLWTRCRPTCPRSRRRSAAASSRRCASGCGEHIHRHGRKFPPRELLHRRVAQPEPEHSLRALSQLSSRTVDLVGGASWAAGSGSGGSAIYAAPDGPAAPAAARPAAVSAAPRAPMNTASERSNGPTCASLTARAADALRPAARHHEARVRAGDALHAVEQVARAAAGRTRAPRARPARGRGRRRC